MEYIDTAEYVVHIYNVFELDRQDKRKRTQAISSIKLSGMTVTANDMIDHDSS